MSGFVHVMSTPGSASTVGQHQHQHIGRHRREIDSGDRSIWLATPGTFGAGAPGSFSRYIGRVGGLAVALGIGVAIAAAPAIALAEPSTTESTSTSPAETTDTTSADKRDTFPKPRPGEPHSPRQPEIPDYNATADIDDTNELTSDDDLPQTRPIDPDTGPSAAGHEIRPTNHTRSTSRRPADDHADSHLPPTRPNRPELPEFTVRDTAASPAIPAAVMAEPAASGTGPTIAGPAREAAKPDVEPLSTPVNLVSAMATAAFGSSPQADPSVPVQAAAMWTLLPLARREYSQIRSTSTPAATAPKLIDDPVPETTRLMAFAEPADNAPVRTADPTLSDADVETGKISGAVYFADPDGDPMSYSAPATTGTGGTVTVVFGTGTFTYTPTEAARMNAGGPEATWADRHDSFVVTVTGYADDGGQLTTTQTVTLEISPLHPVTIIDVHHYATGVAVSPDGTRAYSANDNFVTVIDTSTATVIATIQVAVTSGNPHDIVVSPDGANVYVSVDGGGLAVIDADTYAVHTISIPPMNFTSGTRVGYLPGRLAVDPVSGIVYAAHTVIEIPADGTVSPLFSGRIGAIIVAFDPASGSVTATAQPVKDLIASYGEGTIGALGGTVYFLSYDLITSHPVLVTLDESLAVQGITTLAPHDPFALPGGESLAFSPDGSRTYVIAPTERTLVVVDNQLGTVAATVPLDYPTGVVAVNPVTGHIYVQGQVVGRPGIAVIDPTTLSVVDHVPGIWPIAAISVSADGDYLYASMLGYSSVAQVYIGEPGSGATNHDPYFDAEATGDPDADGAVAGYVHATDPDGDTLSYSAPPATGKGYIEIDSETGEYTYRPTDEARHAAAEDGVGIVTDTFTVTADDGNGGTATTDVTVRIAPHNTIPTVGVIFGGTDPDTGEAVFHLFTGDPATGHSTPLPTNDVDGDTVTYTVVDSPDAGFNPLPVSADGTVQIAHGVVTLDAANMHVYYTPTDDEARHDAAAVKAATGEDLYDGFWVKLDDGHDGVLYIEFKPVIVPVNSPPQFYADQDDPVLGADRTVSGDLIAHDDDGDTLVYSISTPASDGTVDIDPTTGHYTYTPGDDAVFGDDFTIMVTDGHGGSDSYDVEIEIDPVNHPPSIDTIITGTDTATGNVRFDVIVDDPDDDGLHVTFGSPTHGRIRFDDGVGDYVYTPTAAARHAAATDTGAKTDTFLVTVDDERGGRASTTVTVTIMPVNQPPVFDATQSPSGTAADGVVTGPLHATDPDHDTLAYALHTGPGKGRVEIVAATGQFTYTPTDEARHNAAEVGAGSATTTDTFIVTVSDGHGGTDTHTVTVNILPANATPVVTATDISRPHDSDGQVRFRIAADDPDLDTLTTAFSGLATGSTLQFDERTGEWRYTPTTAARHAAAKVGADTGVTTDTFTITVDDRHGGTHSYAVTLDIGPQNSVPVHVSDQDQQSTDAETGAISGRALFYDADGDPLTYVIGGAVAFARAAAPALGSVTLDPATGRYTYTPTTDALATGGVDSFIITATDGYLGTATPITVSVSIPVPGTGPVSPPIPPGTPGSGGGSGGGGGGLLPIGKPTPAAFFTDTEWQDSTDRESDRTEPRRDADADNHAEANPAGPISSPPDPPVPALTSPAAPMSESPSHQAEGDSAQPTVSLTNMVGVGAQGLIMSILLLVIGGWIFTRRVLEA